MDRPLLRRFHCRNPSTHFFFFLLLLLPSLSQAAFTSNTTYLLNCGSSSDAVAADDGRTFVSDSNSNSNSYSISVASSVSITNPNQPTSSSLLYGTARVFTEASSYKFKINSKGTHLVRLHFSSISTNDHNLTGAAFSVGAHAGSVFLLANFTGGWKTTTTTPIIKEYFLWVEQEKLEIRFSPSRNSLAFVNALEVFTAPESLIGDSPLSFTPTGLKSFSGLSRQAMEKVYRINVGGYLITPSNDTLWRTWIPDSDFLYEENLAVEVNTTSPIDYDWVRLAREVAPDNVYSTAQQMNTKPLNDARFNISWEFNVSTGYAYFVRMHFCDFMSKTSDELYFNSYINNQSAIQDLHPFEKTNGRAGAPFYVDFVTDQSQSGLLRVSVGRSERSSSSNANAILNGLEIMKLNNSMGSLDGDFDSMGSLDGDFDLSSGGNYSRKKLIIIILPVLGGLVLIALLVFVLLLVLKCRVNLPAKTKGTPVSWSPMHVDGANSFSHGSKSTEATKASVQSNLRLQIPFDNIMFATNGFDEKLIIGVGGFGKVYKGVMRDGTEVAVKRGSQGSRQGYPEFQTEVRLLSQIRHRHLVSLVGYCEENSQMILVYEYMEKGPLKNHLYGSDSPYLSWKQRLEICIGAARGIHYLHTGSSQGIIHRDVKSSNILIGEDYSAKVSDFGLSRLGPSTGETHVSTGVKGSFGYLDPEYFKTQQLTDKSDVYSFGVVLFEVLCARPVINPMLSRDQLNLAEWALHCQKRGLIEQVVDQRLKGKINSKSLRKFGEIAEKCLEEHGTDRPTIGEVLWNLEYALQLQETELKRESYEDSGNCEEQIPVVADGQEFTSLGMYPGKEETEVGDGSSDTTTSKVFSQLITDEGR